MKLNPKDSNIYSKRNIKTYDPDGVEQLSQLNYRHAIPSGLKINQLEGLDKIKMVGHMTDHSYYFRELIISTITIHCI